MEIFALFPFVFMCLVVALHLILSSAVFSDGQRLLAQEGRRTFLVGPGVWWLITLLGGLIAVVIYWVIHYSTLRPTKGGA